YKVRKSNLSRSHWRAIKSLRADSSIKILPADKGNKTVVMNAGDYLSKLEKRVQAGSNVAIARNPTKSREVALNRLINMIMKDAEASLLASEPSVPWLYGMPKVHKKDCPVREISSAVGSSGHDLAAALSKLLMPMVGKTRTYVRDGYHFVELIQQRWSRFSMAARRAWETGWRMVSLDISAMFPNIPMAEALEVLEKRLGRFEKSGDAAGEGGVCGPYFQCEFGLFKQVDGVPMGGPLSCLISDIFMEDYEEKVVIKLSDGTVIRADWLRFRDDTWMIWEHSQELFDEFLRKLNGIHPKIKWEAVFEENGQLPFLDVLVVRNEDGSFTTTVYRKPTHSDRYLHWTSNHPVKDKLSGIRTLVYRANHYCSTASLKMAELTHLRKTFADNGY
ncbi:unnamed protein product, partial [Heterosigma akashiwo]